MPPDGPPPAPGPEESSALTIVLVSLFSAVCGLVAGFLLGRPGVLTQPLPVSLLVAAGIGMLLGERLGDDRREQVLYGLAGALLGGAGAAASVFFRASLDRVLERILGG